MDATEPPPSRLGLVFAAGEGVWIMPLPTPRICCTAHGAGWQRWATADNTATEKRAGVSRLAAGVGAPARVGCGGSRAFGIGNRLGRVNQMAPSSYVPISRVYAGMAACPVRRPALERSLPRRPVGKAQVQKGGSIRDHRHTSRPTSVAARGEALRAMPGVGSVSLVGRQQRDDLPPVPSRRHPAVARRGLPGVARPALT